MSTMNISIPESMKLWVQSQIETGLYANASDYVRDLIRRDQSRSDKFAALQAAITKGMKSGVSDQSIEAVLKQAREMAQED
ncbi:MAG: type II toxin-antitoxin system ParD family antitoxin [Gammaproteobacteria bacterium]|nr:type II toxin-antitoxin system ParD family antitoxin [Gammaproteobacteria bacterium]